MTDREAEGDLSALLARAGVAVGGGRPCDIRVANPGFHRRVLSGGLAALGESYAEGWWEADRLDEFFHRFFKARLDERLAPGLWPRARGLARRFLHRRGGARGAGAARRPGNDFFRAMLGRRMSYACAFWNGARTLDEAEEAGLELACRKLELRRGMSVLDLGCGWGAFARYAAERHGVSVTGVDISDEAVRLGRELCKGLPVALRVQDHKEVRGRFDRVVSLGLLEDVGPGDYRASMAAAAQCLKADGVALIHAADRAAAPTLALLSRAMEGLFVVEDVHNLGPHHDPTLLAWQANLARRWPELREKYGDRLYRTTTFELLSSAGRFRSRRGQLYQITATRPGRAQPRCRVEPASLREARFVGA